MSKFSNSRLFIAAAAFAAVAGHWCFVAGAASAVTMGAFVLPRDRDLAGYAVGRFGFGDAHALANVRPIGRGGLVEERTKQICQLRGEFGRQ